MSNTLTTFPSAEEICYAGQFAVRNTLENIKRSLMRSPELALETFLAPSRNNKPALRVDLSAEDDFNRNLTKEYQHGAFDHIKVYGEESISERTDFTKKDSEGIIALVDMVDGTDLMERNLSNWCSAAVFFRPSLEEGRRIIAACVGFPSGRIYYAHADKDGAAYKPLNRNPVAVGGPSRITKLSEASISFYGQKATSLQGTMTTQLIDHLVAEPGQTKSSSQNRTRIYTLAGIPMIVKLIDHQVKCAANIDIVFDTNGQQPHDVVPGAYIARKAGAHMLNLETGKEFSDAELERCLLRPGHPESRLRYVVGATSELCAEILPLLTSSPAG